MSGSAKVLKVSGGKAGGCRSPVAAERAAWACPAPQSRGKEEGAPLILRFQLAFSSSINGPALVGSTMTPGGHSEWSCCEMISAEWSVLLVFSARSVGCGKKQDRGIRNQSSRSRVAPNRSVSHLPRGNSMGRPP